MIERPVIAIALALLPSLALSACDGGNGNEQALSPSEQQAEQKTPAPTDVITPTDTPTASIMRPSVVKEAEEKEKKSVAPIEATVYFDFGKATLSDEARVELDKLAAAIAPTNRVATLRGSSDSKGDDRDNMRMSVKRAEAVRDYLVSKGVAPTHLTTIGLGEARPAAPNATLTGKDDEAGRSRNRRVDISVPSGDPDAATPALDSPS